MAPTRPATAALLAVLLGHAVAAAGQDTTGADCPQIAGMYYPTYLRGQEVLIEQTGCHFVVHHGTGTWNGEFENFHWTDTTGGFEGSLAVQHATYLQNPGDVSSAAVDEGKVCWFMYGKGDAVQECWTKDCQKMSGSYVHPDDWMGSWFTDREKIQRIKMDGCSSIHWSGNRVDGFRQDMAAMNKIITTDGVPGQGGHEVAQNWDAPGLYVHELGTSLRPLWQGPCFRPEDFDYDAVIAGSCLGQETLASKEQCESSGCTWVGESYCACEHEQTCTELGFQWVAETCGYHLDIGLHWVRNPGDFDEMYTYYPDPSGDGSFMTGVSNPPSGRCLHDNDFAERTNSFASMCCQGRGSVCGSGQISHSDPVPSSRRRGGGGQSHSDPDHSGGDDGGHRQCIGVPRNKYDSMQMRGFGFKECHH